MQVWRFKSAWAQSGISSDTAWGRSAGDASDTGADEQLGVNLGGRARVL